MTQPSPRSRCPQEQTFARLATLLGLAAVSASTAALGCAGSIGAGNERESSGPGTAAGARPGSPRAMSGSAAMGTGATTAGASGGSGALSAPAACVDARGPAPLRMLTPTEYDNTVRDLLGDTSAPAAAWPTPAAGSGFDNDALAQGTDPNQADLYRGAAEKVAAAAVAANWARIVPCDAKAPGCAATFIDSFGKRAYRRPLTADDRRTLTAAFDLGQKSGGFAVGVRSVLELALQSPHFLYRVELGAQAAGGTAPGSAPAATAAAAIPLTDHEIASRLSYFLWTTMPDDALLTAAEAAQLRTPAQIRAHAERMLADARARPSIASFHRQWLLFDQFEGAARDPKQFPRYSPAVNASMVAGSQQFLANAVLGGDQGTLDELLGAAFGFANADTAPLLGLAASSPARTSRAFVKVALDPRQRAGILTDLTLMASLAKPNQTAPVLRGMFVREHLLCQVIPPPPPDVDNTPPPPDPKKTTRQQFVEHRSIPTCAACHRLMDPLGFGFENYDALGQFHATENGLAVDATGELTNTVGVDGAFDGAVDLAKRLARADEVAGCVTKQWFRYAFGRVDTALDTCALADLRARATPADGGGLKLRDLLLAIVTSTAFTSRPPVEKGACQ